MVSRVTDPDASTPGLPRCRAEQPRTARSFPHRGSGPHNPKTRARHRGYRVPRPHRGDSPRSAFVFAMTSPRRTSMVLAIEPVNLVIFSQRASIGFSRVRVPAIELLIASSAGGARTKERTMTTAAMQKTQRAWLGFAWAICALVACTAQEPEPSRGSKSAGTLTDLEQPKNSMAPKTPPVVDTAEKAAPGCGNATLELDEVCDDGDQNGQPDRCDATCQFRCEGPCPVRVDPARAPGGTGATWQDAMADVQAAVDQQAALGGGEVWVLGDRSPN